MVPDKNVPSRNSLVYKRVIMDMHWLKFKLKDAGLTQRQLADAIGMDHTAFRKMINNHRPITGDESDAIRRYFGHILPEDIPPTISIAGKVAAGDHLELTDEYEKGSGLYSIVRPSWIPPHGVAAAEIEGSSAEPWVLPGDVIFWKREAIAVMPEDLGRPVIAQLSDGRVMLKRLANGSRPGVWSLLSINPTHPNIFDAEVKWASRVLAPLSRDEIKISDS